MCSCANKRNVMRDNARVRGSAETLQEKRTKVDRGKRRTQSGGRKERVAPKGGRGKTPSSSLTQHCIVTSSWGGWQCACCFHLVDQQSAGLGIGSRELSLASAESDVRTAVLEASLLAEESVVALQMRSESPLVRYDDVLASREFVLAATQSLDHMLQVRLLRADRENNLTDVHAGNETNRLTESLTTLTHNAHRTEREEQKKVSDVAQTSNRNARAIDRWRLAVRPSD